MQTTHTMFVDLSGLFDVPYHTATGCGSQEDIQTARLSSRLGELQIR